MFLDIQFKMWMKVTLHIHGCYSYRKHTRVCKDHALTTQTDTTNDLGRLQETAKNIDNFSNKGL